jgi:hypothetical protein
LRGLDGVPEISKFYGIRITMNWADHNPPHFHAEYGDYEALIQFSPRIDIYRGGLPRTALNLCLQWAALHQAELIAAWNRAQILQPIGKIDPLD